jgi:isoleucyl-tRNA synthetase
MSHAFTYSQLSILDTEGKPQREPNVYAPTILLPDTKFDQRANAVVREPEIQAFWKEHDLYEKLSVQAKANGAERFVLHDGPPYANGDLHIGHALNKLLKDFINRKQLLKGKQVHFVPGWDCHGLPIELKVLQNMKSKEREGLTPVDLRAKAAAFAKETVEKQSKSFQRYGVFGDFENPYLTLQPSFEAAQIEVFGAMFEKGYIYRGRKPVHWSPSSKTALAEAELEYPEGHISKSIYVAFTVTQASEGIKEFHSSENPVKVAIWTTTPWTMPANLAVAVNPDLQYSIVNHASTGKLLVATDLIQRLAVRILDFTFGNIFFIH